MRTNEERIAAMHERAGELNRERRMRRVRILQAGSAAAAFAFVILLAVLVSGTAPAGADSAAGAAAGLHASIFAGNGMIGYIVTAIIAFMLGAAVTVLCIRLRKWQREKDQEERL